MKTSALLTLIVVLLVGCSSAPPVVLLSLEAIEAEMEAGNYARAAEALEALVAQEPENADAHFNLGLAYFNLGEYEKAVPAFERVLELDTERASAVYHNLGVLEYQRGRLNEAVAQFQAAIEADPEDPDTHYQLGATYLQQALQSGMQPNPTLVNRARSEFEEALALAPTKTEPLVGLGHVYMLQSPPDPQRAIGVLQEALEHNPEMPEALLALASAYLQNNQPREARAVLEQFLASDPPFGVAEAREMLMMLEE